MMARNALEKINRVEALDMEILITGAPNALHESSYHLDVVDAQEGEPFTLEPFKKCIVETWKSGKDYILAKVTTSDPNNASSLYSYYYSALEINKILFKYESDRHLLHRMKVRNPLNNMYIMGQVYYYKITPEAVDHALQEYDHPSEESVKGCSKAFTAGPLLLTSAHAMEDQIKPRELEYRTISRDFFRAPPAPSPGANETVRKLRVRARYFASDSDFLVKSQVREYFKQNVVNKEDYFIFELERTQNDFLALLDSPETSDSAGDAETWKRALTAHLSIILIIACVLLFFSASPIIFPIVFSLAILFLVTMFCSIAYIFCCRRRTFGSVAVNDVDSI